MSLMLTREVQHQSDMGIIKPVVSVAAVTTVAHDRRSTQQPHRLRHLCFGGLYGRGDIADAQLATLEQDEQDSDTRRVAGANATSPLDRQPRPLR